MGGSRRRRLIHRHGAVFRATLRPEDGDPATAAAMAPAGRPALVRISTTFGWPPPLPDWAGMAIRLLPPAGDGARAGSSPPIDLLLASAATTPDLWCRLEPHRDVLACAFTTAVRHRIDGADQIVVAVPAEPRTTTLDQLIAGDCPGPIRYRLDGAVHRGDWRCLGELVLTELLGEDHNLRFSPPRTGPRLFTTVRRLVYRLAQGRAAAPPPGPSPS